MASRKRKDSDRPVMDMSGRANEPKPAPGESKTFFDEAADDDRVDAKTRHANKGLRTAKELVGVMAKAVAHGLASESQEVKLACLEEVADLGNAARDACRAAKRSAAAETKNVQG